MVPQVLYPFITVIIEYLKQLVKAISDKKREENNSEIPKHYLVNTTPNTLMQYTNERVPENFICVQKQPKNLLPGKKRLLHNPFSFGN